MLRRLKIKIIVVVLGTLLIVFAAVLLALNLSVYQTSVKRTEDFMAAVVENDGLHFPHKGKPGPPRDEGRESFGSPEIMRAGRFFYAKLNENGEILELNLEMMFDFSKEDAEAFIAYAAETKRGRGDMENYSYISAEKPYGRMFVFAERSIEITLLEHLTKVSLLAAGVVSLVLACLSAFFAQWMVAPVKTAFDKQRRFVSDASHELKTPLTIIGANADVLQGEIGENQRLAHIKAQSERMSGLVNDLLALAKTDEGAGAVMSRFDLSGAVLGTALEFESRAYEEGKRYSCDIAENMSFMGDEKRIRQLVSLLMDNAIRYSDAGGLIEVSLRAAGGRPRISVYNTGAGVPDKERGKIFERFYRSDESRSRETGGYGIGLSIALAIVESHKGHIAVSGEYGKWVRFDVTL